MNGFPVKAGRPAGGYHYCGNSMRRVFRPGDVLVLATVPFERLRCGDVICFRNTAGKQIVHRIVGWRPDGAVTQGDNNDCVDAEPVAAENYFGRVEAFQRGRRRRRMRNGPAGMRQFHWNRCRRRCRLTLAGSGGGGERRRRSAGSSAVSGRWSAGNSARMLCCSGGKFRSPAGMAAVGGREASGGSFSGRTIRFSGNGSAERLRDHADSAGSLARQAATLSPLSGKRQSAAISASGASTKRR